MTTKKPELVNVAGPNTHVLAENPVKLSQLFPGEHNATIRNALIKDGRFRYNKAELKATLRPIGDDDHEIIALGTIAFDPGPTLDFINTIQDFIGQGSGANKTTEVQLMWEIYKKEGIINNAINKIAAILSGGGSFKVRNAKQGRKPEPVNRLLRVLQYYEQKVNTASKNSVITGAQGLQTVTHQGVRRALVEGDWVARHVWSSTEIPNEGNYVLPMNIQSISAQYLEPVKGLEGSTGEAFYWKPPSTLISGLRSSSDKYTTKILKKLISRDIQTQLEKDGKAFLDPALMLHVKHRGVDTDTWGESFITPALQAIAYKRSIDDLDFSTMKNLINRLTIVTIGSEDPNSPYNKSDVALARAALMQSFFEEPGPNMTIIWGGKDVGVINVGASDVLSLDTRHEIGINKVKDAIGVAEALLSGSTPDGKAAGWAASLGNSAQLEELQTGFANAWTEIGEKIAEENGFTNVELVFEFDRSLQVDRIEEMNQTRNDYIAGIATLHDIFKSRGKDPQAMFVQRCFERGLDPATTSWETAFLPPQGMAGQAPVVNGPGQGRPSDQETGKPTEVKPEKRTTVENK